MVTPTQMAAIDAAAPEPVEELIERAGAAVDRAARTMLGGTYGRRVVVLAGKGNNGADGRSAARRLRRRGVRVTVVDVSEAPEVLPDADLVIDAAFGTGFHGTWSAPCLGDLNTPVLAVDLPSGLSGATGERLGSPLPATHTVTFAAAKPGQLFGTGPALCGTLEVVDIGLDVSTATVGIVTATDVAAVIPVCPTDSHKWRAALWVIAGSARMPGAAQLTARAALRTGAGYVRRTSPGSDATTDPPIPVEAVAFPVPVVGLLDAVDADGDRFGALAIGPGLGEDPAVRDMVRAVLDRGVTAVVDADGLRAVHRDDPLPSGPDGAPRVVVTPHEGEFVRMGGDLGTPTGSVERIEAVRSLARALGAVVLLKGPCTVVAHPGGDVAIVREGDARLATAGTGDVLTGIVGALLARGLAPFDAAWAGAFLHGRAARCGPRYGLVAGDLPDLVPAAVASIIGDGHAAADFGDDGTDRAVRDRWRPTPPRPDRAPLEQVSHPMSQATVSTFMTRDVLSFTPDEPVPDAVASLVERGVDAAPVLDADGRVVGMLSSSDVMIQGATVHLPTIITLFGMSAELPVGAAKFDRDVHHALASTVGELMGTDPVTIGPDASMNDAATLMHDHDVSRLPVVDDSGTLVGIVARGDVMRHLVTGMTGDVD